MKLSNIVVLVLTFSTKVLLAETPRLPDRTTAPTRPRGAAEKVARFDFPPGHVTVSRDGRIFMDALASDSKATHQVIELRDGKMIPFPSIEAQKEFKTIHGIFVDHADRLWILDHGYTGILRAPRLFGYDIKTGAEIENYKFPRDVVGYGSMINDVVADPVREKLYISDTSPIAKKSGIVVFDIATRTSRRVLHDHPSVRDTGRKIYVEGKPFTVIGLVKPSFGLDGLSLDPSGKWLYYAAFNGGVLYRVPVDKIVDATLPAEALGAAVEKVADITMTDGILVDERQRVYLSDVEHSAVVREAGGRLETIFKHPEFSWPTGYSMSRDGWIYFTCNAIQDTKLRSREEILKRGPYFLYRFRP